MLLASVTKPVHVQVFMTMTCPHCQNVAGLAHQAAVESRYVSLLCLVALGAVAARVGGAPILVGASRVTIWGLLAMLVTAAIGRLFGTTVG
jgi:VIT1/CCC1 family predicted Fe2+/Mn2+ transporter